MSTVRSALVVSAFSILGIAGCGALDLDETGAPAPGPETARTTAGLGEHIGPCVLEGEPCTEDLDCVSGTVCQKKMGFGLGKCVAGCHTDDQCSPPSVCNGTTTCLPIHQPCIGRCTLLNEPF